MKSPLRILYLEDNFRDAELVEEILSGDGLACDVVRVENEADFVASLEQHAFDLIFADYTLPSFDGISALKIARQKRPDVSFIFISGTLGEEVAIEALKIGATDYVFKTRLSRIVPAVRRALREAQERNERKGVEEALRRSEAYLTEAERLSHTGSFGWNLSTGEIYWSRETFRIFGYEPAGKATIEMALQRTHPEDRTAFQQLMDKVAREMKPFEFERRLLMPDGSTKYLRAIGHPSTAGTGTWEIVGAISDVTAARIAEEKIRQDERQLRLIVDTIPGLVWTMTASGDIEMVNRQMLDYLGKTLEELKDSLEFIHPDDRERVIACWVNTIGSGQPFELEHRLRRADGVHRWFQSRGRPLRDPEGYILRWYNLLSDIDERKRAEEKLRRSEWNLLEAQRLGRAGSWSLNISSGNVTASPEMFRAFDAKPGDDCSRPDFWFDRIHPEDRKRVRDLFEKCLVEKSDYEAEYRLLLPDGTIKHQHSIGYPILNEAGDLVEFVGTAVDVTEQVTARIELENALEEIKHLKDRLQDENLALRDEVVRASMFEEIVGTSPALQVALARVAKVAPTDSTVLISGETGTGKELFARAIHKRSPRSARAFVSVNCAATPSTLIASELFGHEKGAFTGALQRRLGRFELAEGGTIFLDEIGELPLETQVALLRVLQEREFERVGGSQVIRTDVRVIAATNRDLESAIAGGAFRKDLFYRLNVFPIEIPPLRERRADIPTLVEYFVHRYSRKVGKRIRAIEKRTLELLGSYAWPGNIRELQNVIERSVIFCESDLFSVDPSWLSFESSSPTGEAGPIARMSPVQQREAIETALAATAGRVSGPSGAAAHLSMPASTLESKIRTLKINKFRFKKI
jgi:PAS domain S-box-containing protein